jgi:hypothetical protein
MTCEVTAMFAGSGGVKACGAGIVAGSGTDIPGWPLGAIGWAC